MRDNIITFFYLMFFLFSTTSVGFSASNTTSGVHDGFDISMDDVYKKIDLSVKKKSLIEVLYQLEELYQVQFKFDHRSVPYYAFEREFRDVAIYKIVETLCDGSAIRVIVLDPKTIVLADFRNFSRDLVTDIVKKWDEGIYKYPFDEDIQKVFLGGGNSENSSQKAFQLDLTFLDAETQSPIIGGVMFTEDLALSFSSDVVGTIKTRLPTDQYEFTIQYIGYRDVELTIDLYESVSATIEIERKSLQIEEVEITARSERMELEQAKAGVTSLSTQQLEAIPQASGEVDILKSLEVLPGVTSAGDLSSGFNVRGGRIDESLVLFNDAIIFNPTHVVGFISAFNADIINDANLYKGYVDSEYGNRSSAVLDLQGKYGNNSKTRLRAGVGTSMVKATVDGPIGRKITYTLSARGSYSDYLLNRTGIPELKRSDASFYDVYGAFKWKINDRHQLRTSTYSSADIFQYNEQFGFNWSNFFVNTTLFSQWNKNLSSSLKATYGSYENEQFTLNNSSDYTFLNGIRYSKLNASASHRLWEASSVKVGVEYIDYTPLAETLLPRSTGSTTLENVLQRNGSLSISPYISTTAKLLEWWTVEAGLRNSNYIAKGPAKRYYYESELPSLPIIEVDDVEAGDHISSTSIWEPRISSNFLVSRNFSVKLAYGKIAQNAQIISLGNTSIPTDIWVFSNNYIKPRIVDQYSTDLTYLHEPSKLKLAVGYFYKSTANFFVLRDFPEIIGNPHIETELLNAEQRSQGFELQVEKSTEKWDLFSAYTFSQTRFRSDDQRGSVNNGDRYPGDIDIPHQVNILASYQLVPTIKLNLAYVYKTGRPITVPAGIAPIDNVLIPFYGDRNSGRIPAYSRLDISMSIDLRKIRLSGYRNSFTFGVFNLLGNQNAFNVFYRTNEVGALQAYKFSVIGAAIPSITWNCVIN